MKIRFKRVVSAVCALALCASMIPASALAEPVVSGTDNAIVEQLENTPDQDSVGTVVSGAGQENEEMIAVEGEEGTEPAAPAEGEEDTQQPAAPVEGEEDTQQPTAPVEGEEDTQQPTAPVEGEEGAEPAAPAEGEEDTQQPTAPAEDEAGAESVMPAVSLMSDAPQSRASYQRQVTVGSSLPIEGNGGTDAYGHNWSISSGGNNIAISGASNERNVTIQANSVGPATLVHTYKTWEWFLVWYEETHTDTYRIDVVPRGDAETDVFLFLATPGDYSLPSDGAGAQYYFLSYGGEVSEYANTSLTGNNAVINLTDESEITKFVDTWPTELMPTVTNTSSKPVEDGSWWTINETTGEVTQFRLILKQDNTNKEYTSDKYALQWAKFSYADTNGTGGTYGSRYHVDAVLYEKKTVEKVVNDLLNAKKQLTDFSLDENGDLKSTETFNFVLVALDDQNQETGTRIPLTAEVNKTGTPVDLNAGENAKKILPPGKYKLYEKLGEDTPVWQAVNPVIFQLNTNGTITCIQDVHGETAGNYTFTNTPATYTLRYVLNDGQSDDAFNAVSGLKYNEKTNVASETPTKSGNVFLGWATEPNGTTPFYQPGAGLQIEGDTILYAIWKPVSVTKNVVLSNTPVDDDVVNKAEYATVITDENKKVTYTTDGTAKILYQVKVNAYVDAIVTITENATGGTASYVAAVGATTTNGTTFTMTENSATLYYAVEVKNVSNEGTEVGNSVDWDIYTQSGTASADDVTVYKTGKTLAVTKQIKSVSRNGNPVPGSISDATVLCVGDIVTWEITVTNTSKTPLEDVQVTDTTSAEGQPEDVTLKRGGSKDTELTWPTNSKTAIWNIGDLAYDLENDQGESVTITYTYKVLPADASEIGKRDLTNTVTAGPGFTANTATTANFVEAPKITVEKTGDLRIANDGNSMLIDYTIKVKNTGNVALTSLALEDEKYPKDQDGEITGITVKIADTDVASNKISTAGDTVTVTEPLQPNKELVLTFTYTVTGTPNPDGELTVTNTVTATGTTGTNATVEKEASCITPVYQGKLTIALAPIVIYTGGDGSSQAIVGEEGQPTTGNDNGLPTFGVTMTLPEGDPVTVNDGSSVPTLYDLKEADNSWTAMAYNANATELMLLNPEGESRDIRIQLKDEEGQTVEDYKFNVENTLYRQYNTSLYVKEDQDATIIAEVKDKFYTVNYKNSTLTIRGATEQAENSKVVNDVSQLTQNAKYPEALLPVGTQYCYVSSNGDNKGQLKVANTSGVSLLVDEIVDQNVPEDQKYVQLMKDHAETKLLGSAPAGSNRAWRFYYMDLVLKTNGNAVLTADQDATIYWPYPNGITYQDAVSGNYTFKVVHYGGLARNYASAKFENELEDCKLTTYQVTATEKGLRFTVPEADGFSPFALVYERVVNNDQGGSSDNNNSNNNTNTVSQAKAEETVDQPATAPAAVTLIPQTGDDMPFALLAVVAALAAAAVVALAVLRRRSKK